MLPLFDKSLMLGGTEADPVSHHYVVSLVFTVLFVLQNGRDVYYVLYSIKIIHVLYLYYVLPNPGMHRRLLTLLQFGCMHASTLTLSVAV